MRVLINNPHNDSFGGGELYTYQVAKAVSNFAEVSFLNLPNANLYSSNPDLRIKGYKIFSGLNSTYDYFFDICHFKNLKCNLADRNIKVVFFPKYEMAPNSLNAFDSYVAICEYTQRYIKEYWGKESLICKPYSGRVKPLSKKRGTIVSIGNFFREPDGHSKGQEYLIEVLKQLPGHKLTLIGHTVCADFVLRLKALSVGLDVEVLTDLPERDKLRILGESEFYWHANGFNREDPAQTEHFGIAPEEGLKAGCLTYVHKSGGAQDFCRTWEKLEDLVDMTKRRVPNFEEHNFQTPDKMEAFWRKLLV